MWDSVLCLPEGTCRSGNSSHRASFRRDQKVRLQDLRHGKNTAVELEVLGLNSDYYIFSSTQYRGDHSCFRGLQRAQKVPGVDFLG